jgi:hypothetical protein
MQFIDTRPEAIRSIRHRWLLKYWCELRGNNPLPAWRQVDAQEIARAADCAVIFEVVGNGGEPRFRIRYQGVRITEAYGADCSGKFLDEVQPPGTRETTLAIYRHAVETARPLYTIAQMRDAQGQAVEHERLMLPFGNDGSVSRIFTTLETVAESGDFQQQRLLSAPSPMAYALCAAIDLSQTANPAMSP